MPYSRPFFFSYFYTLSQKLPFTAAHTCRWEYREFVLLIQSRFLVLAEKVKNVPLAAWPRDTFFLQFLGLPFFVPRNDLKAVNVNPCI